jgi:hypothetical protein
MPAVLTPFSIIKSLTTENEVMHMCSDGIMEIHYGDVQYNLEMAKTVTDNSGKVCDHKKVLVLNVASRFSDVDSDARVYMSSDYALQYSIAEAFVLKSLSQRLIGNFYLKFQRPKVPTKLFSEIIEARKWLLKQKKA